MGTPFKLTSDPIVVTTATFPPYSISPIRFISGISFISFKKKHVRGGMKLKAVVAILVLPPKDWYK